MQLLGLTLFGQTLTAFATRCILVFFGYKAYQSIETAGWQDDAHWLTFWLLYSIIQFLELFVDFILFWVPFYYELKVGLIIYLGLMGGATTVYEAFGKKCIRLAEDTAQTLSQREDVRDLHKKVQSQMSQLQDKLKQPKKAAPGTDKQE
eukprot:NODE_740_length_715_cov_192.759760_g673_i0.p1 GENE.NODE_740_length_715_cov_192.759760_g673_i0~~NODE_740_length_715_cov_192.759760_g673_i0.p1  ORF type:complete len:160 (-),score=36.26 NODE_740_length_715_cov_192.759760_g673_i0:234-680(-)